jgi:hypothetical protein
MAIGDLAFLTGRWQGQGFVMEFGTPAGTMLFGSMQAFESGRTVYWENFRFAEESGDLICYSLQRDAPAGRYPLTRFFKTSETLVSFENPSDQGRRRLAFGVSGDGELVMTQEGERAGSPVRQDWALRRLA